MPQEREPSQSEKEKPPQPESPSLDSLREVQGDEKAKMLYGHVAADFDHIAKQIEAGYTERARNFFDFTARMYKYSSYNIDLIYAQAPYAQFVQSFTAWNRGGYRIKKREEGGQGIAILQPRPYTRIEEKDENGQIVRVETPAVYFTVAYVFDISAIDQTYKQVPLFETPLQGNADQLTVRLLELLSEDGILVKEDYPVFNPRADGESLGGQIFIRPGMDSVRRFLVLAHEAGHEWLHKAEVRRAMTKTEKETQAELFAYIIASHFGIRSPFSADYIKAWGGNDRKYLKEQLDILQQQVKMTIERMEAEYNLYTEFAYDETEDNANRQERKGKGMRHRQSRRNRK